MARNVARLALGIALSLSPVSAFASESYPAYVTQVYQLPREPECTLCHATLEGGDGTVTRAFGENLEARGARGKNPRTLQSALVEAAQARQDSDGDGVTDLQELRDETDPNVEGDAVPGEGGAGAGGDIDLGSLEALPPLPGHGCAAGISSHKSGLVSLALLGAVVALRRRRRSESAA
jgi:MYXO-CTERM domain-containing protein